HFGSRPAAVSGNAVSLAGRRARVLLHEMELPPLTTGQPTSPGYAPPPMPRGQGSGSRRQTPRGWWPMVVLSFMIALYALSFYARGDRAFSPELFASFTARPWGIYSHVLFGSIALAIGPFQFRRGILSKRRALHRNLGKVYVICAFMTGLVGLYMSAYSFGGINTHLGFGVLGA